MLVCLFDIDGTLLATSGAGRLAMDAALRAEFGIDAPITPGQISGRTDRSIARDQFRLHNVDDSPENWRRFINAYLTNLPASLSTNLGRILPGVTGLLEALNARGDVALGLLTGNVPAGAQLKLSHYGIDHYFSFGAFGDRHDSRDDVARDALAYVCSNFNGAVALDDIWVIGDTPWDVRCARAIGARAAAVATGIFSTAELEAEQPELVLADLSDPRLRRAWLGS
jgi:phosphoglycolate phosphatase